uniref:Uncharacterized protein n=1 Tax=Nothoprocta perdicaria TaxID=30464 RepID=A0A8C7EDD2_NOTPE
GTVGSAEMDCHFSVWGVLAFLSLALIVSLIFNISQYIRKKREAMITLTQEMTQFMAISVKIF